MSPFRHLIFAIIAGGCLAACATPPLSAGLTREIGVYGTTLADEADVFVDEASADDVLDLLGPPVLITALPEGYAFLYAGGRLDNTLFGVSIYAFRAGYSWSAARSATAVFVFDDENRLIGQALEERDEGTGRGFSIGVQRAQAADQAAYLLPSSQHGWGRSMLRRLGLTLMDDTSLSSGQHGLEQRATTTRVGQRTLEASYSSPLALLELLRQQTGQ